MNYPIWFVPAFGGGLLIALVAIVHVFVSHFWGAGYWCGRGKHQGKKPAIMDVCQKHTSSLAVTMSLAV